MKRVLPETLEKELEYLRLLDYGAPGSGKTWFGASAALSPLTSPALFLEYRSQAATLASSPEYRKALTDGRLVMLRLEKYDELNHIWAWLNGSPRKALDDLFSGGKPKTVILDSLTELQRLEVLRRGGNPLDTFLTDVSPPEIREWGTLLNQFALLANLFYVKLPMHVVFSALEVTKYRVEGITKTVAGFSVALQGRAQDQVPANALTLMRLVRAAEGAQDGQGRPVFNVGYTRQGMSASKEQSGAFPKRIPNPTIPMLVGMLRARKEALQKEERTEAATKEN